MSTFIHKWPGLIISFLAVFILLLTGCGKEENPNSITIPASTGEKIEVTLDTSDDFHMEKPNEVLLVYQKKKVMLRLAFISKEEEIKQRSAIITMPFEIYEERDDYISYAAAGSQGMVTYYMYPVGEKTWLYAGTHLPKEAADKVLSRLHFKEVKA